MQLKRYTDYSLRVLIYTGLHKERLVTIGEISEHFGISRNHLVKVVHDLATRGFLESTRGRSGGIRLARPPEDIGVGNVVRQMEGSSNFVECYNPHCPIEGACSLQGIMAEGQRAFVDVLERYSIADLIRNKADLLQLVG